LDVYDYISRLIALVWKQASQFDWHVIVEVCKGPAQSTGPDRYTASKVNNGLSAEFGQLWSNAFIGAQRSLNFDAIQLSRNGGIPIE
jgi:hypothetical protein